MKDVRTTRRLIQQWRRREKATLDHLVSTIGDATAGGTRILSPMTSSGLVVEDQIRKTWDTSHGGLPVF